MLVEDRISTRASRLVKRCGAVLQASEEAAIATTQSVFGRI